MVLQWKTGNGFVLHCTYHLLIKNIRSVDLPIWQNYFDWRLELDCWKLHEHFWARMFVQDVLWTSYVRSNYVLCLRGNKKELFKKNNSFEVGISDHHSFAVTALKSQLLKRNAKTKLYGDYSSSSLDIVKEDLENSSKINFITE